jgi:ankyrin repeat protein
VELLLAQVGIEVDLKDTDGRTPLSFSAERGSVEGVHLLLKWDGIKVDSKDIDGRTPLSFAAGSGSEVMWLLLAWDGRLEGHTWLDTTVVRNRMGLCGGGVATLCAGWY